MRDRIVVIGASAGGLEALRVVAAALPADFAAPIVVVMHMSAESPGILHEIINRAGALRASEVHRSERLRSGHIYVPPTNAHLVIEPGQVRPTRGPKENRFRPAIDPLFRTAAQVYGPAAIGVILTGNLDDGTAGLWAIKKLGGTAVIQDPRDASFPAMPLSAARHVDVDHSMPLSEIAPLLVRLTAAPRISEGIEDAPRGSDRPMRCAPWSRTVWGCPARPERDMPAGRLG
jgi:two-component system chemotaxis response regulator CheB